MTATQPTTNPYTQGQAFLAAAIQNPNLAYQYITAIQNDSGNPQAGTTWLQQNGYQTTSTQVYQALLFGFQNELAFWQEVYGLSQLSEPSNSNNTQNGPVLTIAVDPNTGNAYPIFGGSSVSTFQFTPGTNTKPNPSLSFTISQYGFSYEVDITFFYCLPFTISPPVPNPIPSNFSGGDYTVESYSGGETWFTGTITINGTTSNYMGEPGQPVSFPINCWTGYYGATIFTTSGSNTSSPGQTLILQPNGSGGFAVSVGGTTINNWTYNCALNLLAWTTSDNSTAGSITFYQAQSSSSSSSTYNGPAFTGTYTDGGITYTYQGILSSPSSLDQWIGSYGVTILSQGSSDPILGPELEVYISNNSPQVVLNFGNNQTATIPQSAINSFNQAINTLTWTSSSLINTSGSIKFGQQTAPTSGSNYIGNYFTGSLTLSSSVGSNFSAGSYSSYSGEIGVPLTTTGGSTSSQTSSGSSKSKTGKMIELYILMGFLGGIGMKVFEGIWGLVIELPAKWLYSKVSDLINKYRMTEENAPPLDEPFTAEKTVTIEQKQPGVGDDNEAPNISQKTQVPTEEEPPKINATPPESGENNSPPDFKSPSETPTSGPPTTQQIHQAGQDSDGGDDGDDGDPDETKTAIKPVEDVPE